MKRVLSVVLVVFMLISASGCREDKNNTNTGSIVTGLETDSFAEFSDDFDENGNLNLYSTKNRHVIKTSFGYYIFHFEEIRLVHLTVVYDEETPEAAQEMYDSMSSPGYTQTDFQQVVLSGQYIVCAAKEDSTRYGYLFKMSKLDILNSFYKKNAESKEQ